MDYIEQSQGSAWKALRERMGLSMEEAGRRIGWAANPSARMCNVEAGDAGLTGPKLARLLDGLGYQIDIVSIRDMRTREIVGVCVPRAGGRSWEIRVAVEPLAQQINRMCPDDAEADELVRQLRRRVGGFAPGAFARLAREVAAKPWYSGKVAR